MYRRQRKCDGHRVGRAAAAVRGEEKPEEHSRLSLDGVRRRRRRCPPPSKLTRLARRAVGARHRRLLGHRARDRARCCAEEGYALTLAARKLERLEAGRRRARRAGGPGGRLERGRLRRGSSPTHAEQHGGLDVLVNSRRCRHRPARSPSSPTKHWDLQQPSTCAAPSSSPARRSRTCGGAAATSSTSPRSPARSRHPGLAATARRRRR